MSRYTDILDTRRAAATSVTFRKRTVPNGVTGWFICSLPPEKSRPSDDRSTNTSLDDGVHGWPGAKRSTRRAELGYFCRPAQGLRLDIASHGRHPDLMAIDLNADLGESYGAWSMGDDAAMLDVVTSASIACGFHAGDPLTMARTVAAAAERGVAIGAHVGYRDRDGFGRRFFDIDPAELHAECVYQLGALAGACRAAGTRLAYVKPHGALYHAITTNAAQAAAVVAAIVAFDPQLPLLGLPDTQASRLAARAGLTTVREAFADRAYTPQGSLLPRDRPGAVLHDPDEVAERIVHLVSSGTITATDGTTIQVAADSVCVHGDSPNAVAMARAVRTGLEAAGIPLHPFAGPS